MRTYKITLLVLASLALSTFSFGQCYEFGITDGYFDPADPVPSGGMTELTFEVCNDGEALPVDPQGGMGFNICPSVDYLSPVGTVYGSAAEYFSFISFFGCELGTQTATIPAGACIEFKIMYESIDDSMLGDFVDDFGNETGLHCATANIIPSGIYSGGTCHDTSDDYYQVCTWTESIALPVELSEFTATKMNTESLLKWNTASEINNAQFDIERSKDGIHFEKIGEVAGAGNSITELEYEFVDTKPFTGVNYYRLNQIDFDGRSTVSPIRQLEFDAEAVEISIYPNPVVDYVNVETTEQGASLQVYDMHGKLLLENDLDASSRVNTQDLLSGAYIFRVTNANGEFIKTQKILVSK